MGYYANIKGEITARFESDDDRCDAAIALSKACASLQNVMRVKPQNHSLSLVFDTTDVRWDGIEEALEKDAIPLLNRHHARTINGAIEVASENPTGDVMPILSRLLVEDGRCRTQRGRIVYE